MKKGQIVEEHIKTLNMYKSNNRAEKHEAKPNRFRNRKCHYCVPRN